MLILPQQHPIGHAIFTRPRPSLVFCGNASDVSNLSVYTYSNRPTGTPHTKRKTIIGVFGEEQGTADFSVTGVTVDGRAATEVVDTANVSSNVQCAIYIIDNPIEFDADIVVTFSEAILAAAVGVWAAYNLLSSVPVVTATAFDTAAGVLNLGLIIPVHGIGIGVSASSGNSATVTWTGLTERFDTLAGTEFGYSGADLTRDSPIVPFTATADWTGTDDAIGAVASFR